MNAVIALHLFILCSLAAVVQADDGDCSVICEDVSETVGNEVTLTCSVSQQCSQCCVKMYKFLYPDTYEDSMICKEDLHDCDQTNSFTCSFTPNTTMTETFVFFFQTTCEWKATPFTVNITELVSDLFIEVVTPETTTARQTTTEAPDETEEPTVLHIAEIATHEKEESRGPNIAVIAAVVSCFIIVILAVIYKLKQNAEQSKTAVV